MFVAGAHVEPPVQSFVRTLFSLANGPYEATLIEWSEDGRQIIVRDMDMFASSICPRFFRHENWSSFSRMLNMYQFHKLPMSRSQERVTGYEHRFFYRGGADELYRVVRKKKAAHGGDPAKARATAEVTPYSSPRLSADPLLALADTAQAAQRRSPPSREPRPPTGNAGTRLPTIMRALDGTGAHGVLPTNRGDVAVSAAAWRRRATDLETEVVALQRENAFLRTTFLKGGYLEGEPRAAAPPPPKRARTSSRSASPARVDSRSGSRELLVPLPYTL